MRSVSKKQAGLGNHTVLVLLNYLVAILFVAAKYSTRHCFCGKEMSSHHFAQELSGCQFHSFALSGETTVTHQCK